MNIATVGNQREFKELNEKFGAEHNCIHFTNHEFLNTEHEFDCIFDFSISDDPEHFAFYEGLELPPVFLNTIKMTLAELAVYYPFKEQLFFGFNGLPTFVDREILEVSTLADQPDLDIFKQLNTKHQIVEDRVGMVTPRIICMIINEAFYTVQEGTASPEDIDLGMKLGTNYPMGPFEWAEKIGLPNVYELLEALYEETKEERYKIAAALKKDYLKTQRLIQP